MKIAIPLFIAALLCWSGCDNSDVEIKVKTGTDADELPDSLSGRATYLPACDTLFPGPGVNPDLLDEIPKFDGFDYPVGKPDAKDYYKYRGFLGMEHLGEDWNGIGGGNTDFFDRLYAAGNGIVYYSGDLGGGWGEVIRILHDIGKPGCPEYVETIYAHLRSRIVRAGFPVDRGSMIGSIGDANGKYAAHLHFEIRTGPAVGKPIGAGYDGDTIGFRDPTRFIEARRPKR